MPIYLGFLLILFSTISIKNVSADSSKPNEPTSAYESAASCGPSEGFSYYVFEEGNDNQDLGWKEDRLSNFLSLIKYEETGKLDILHGSNRFGYASTIDNGGQFKSATMADNAATIVVVYPNKSVETYIFQKLENGEDQVLWTQTVAEKPFRKIASWVSPCKFINLGALF